MNKIQNIIEEIKKLEKELLLEVEKKEDEFFYRIKGKKIYFEEEAKKYQRKFHVKLSAYLIQASFFNLMTFPIIWINRGEVCTECFQGVFPSESFEDEMAENPSKKCTK